MSILSQCTGQTITIRGEGGIRVDLDKGEVCMDDPGQGTPAIVRIGQYQATLDCAMNVGELENSRGDIRKLTQRQIDWLWDQQEQFYDWLGIGLS